MSPSHQKSAAHSSPSPTVTPTPTLRRLCETCEKSHDGTFGAGRFCSSRCARTVGGLAHRKKRALERSKKQEAGAKNRIHHHNQAARIAISSLLNPK